MPTRRTAATQSGSKQQQQPEEEERACPATGAGQRLDEAVQTQAPSAGHQKRAHLSGGQTNGSQELDNRRYPYLDFDFDYADGDDDDDYDDDYDNAGDNDNDDDERRERHLLAAAAAAPRRRSVSLNDILAGSFVHEAASGEQIIVSRGWPLPRATATARAGARRRASSAQRRSRQQEPQVRLRSRLNETQKRKLLMQFLGKQRRSNQLLGSSGPASRQPKATSSGSLLFVGSKPSEVESAMRLDGAARDSSRQPRRASILKLNIRRSAKSPDPEPSQRKGPAGHHRQQSAAPSAKRTTTTGGGVVSGRSLLAVQYDLPAACDGRQPIALGRGASRSPPG